MGYTLDQLLSETGVNELSGKSLSKKASAAGGYNLSKLAERCRRAVETTPQEYAAASGQELVEKTAAVAIIGRTLAEIDAIDGASPEATKTAAAQSPGPNRAEFIKAALEAGHSPEAIATFLKEGGIASRLGMRLQEAKAGRRHAKAMKAMAKQEITAERSMGEWHDLIRKLKDAPPQQKEALISRMRRRMGDQNANDIILSAQGHGFGKIEGFKNLQKSVAAQAAKKDGTKPFAASVGIGGKQVGLTQQQMKKMKTPAFYAGAGYLGAKALGRKEEQPRSGRGPVIITG